MAGEWSHALLRELIQHSRDGEWGSDEAAANRVEMLVVRGTDFERLRVGDLSNIPKRFIEAGAAERKQLRANDVLIETAGGTKDQSTGRSALVKQRHIEDAGVPVTCASFARFLRLDPARVDPQFVYWWLQHLHASGELETHQVQHTGVARFQFTRFADTTRTPLPPLPEQHAIAHFLGTLDEKIELNRRTSETLEAMARALFQSWFVDFDPVRAKAQGRDAGLPKHIADLFPNRLVDSELGEVPEGWKEGTLGSASVLNSEVWTQSTRPPRIQYVDLSSTKWGRIETVTPYALADAPSRAQRVLRPGDTIVGTVRPGNGSYTLISETGLTGSTGFAVLRPKSGNCKEFVYLAATSRGSIESLSHLADGGAYPAVRPEVVAARPCVLPTDAILSAFSRHTGALITKISHNHSESRTLAALRDALLPRLISGDVRVKDAERFVSGIA